MENDVGSEAAMVDWEHVKQSYVVGSSIERTISRVVDGLGLFVPLESGLDALVHRTHIEGLDGRLPHECFSEGQTITASVIEIDDQLRRVQLATKIAPADVPPAAPSLSAEDERAAVLWLGQILAKHPLHTSLLCELTRRWHVPKPVSRFVIDHGFRCYTPSDNPYVPHPVAADPARVDDPAYWRNVLVHLPAETGEDCAASSCAVAPGQDAPDSATPSDPLPAKAAEGSAKPILIDGSNIMRTFAYIGGGKALAAVMDALRAKGRDPVVLFDATIPYCLKHDDDAYGLELLERLRREDPNKAVIVPAGTTADDFLLIMADRHGYGIVSCDTYKPYYMQYAWLKNRAESGEKRLHPPTFILGELVIPSLGVLWSLADGRAV